MPLTDIKSQLPALSFADLQELQADIAKAIEERAEQERKAVLAEMEELARQKGFAGIEAVLGSQSGSVSKPRKRGTVPPKYRNPANADETWTGRGRKPKWVVAALEAGSSLDDFLIDKG